MELILLLSPVSGEVVASDLGAVQSCHHCASVLIFSPKDKALSSLITDFS